MRLLVFSILVGVLFVVGATATFGAQVSARKSPILASLFCQVTPEFQGAVSANVFIFSDGTARITVRSQINLEELQLKFSKISTSDNALYAIDERSYFTLRQVTSSGSPNKPGRYELNLQSIITKKIGITEKIALDLDCVGLASGI